MERLFCKIALRLKCDLNAGVSSNRRAPDSRGICIDDKKDSFICCQLICRCGRWPDKFGLVSNRGSLAGASQRDSYQESHLVELIEPWSKRIEPDLASAFVDGLLLDLVLCVTVMLQSGNEPQQWRRQCVSVRSGWERLAALTNQREAVLWRWLVRMPWLLCRAYVVSLLYTCSFIIPSAELNGPKDGWLISRLNNKQQTSPLSRQGNNFVFPSREGF